MMIQLQGLLSTITFLDVIDIVVVAYFLYRLFLMLKNTRAATLGKGLMVLIGFTLICRWLNLHVISWLLEKGMTVIMVSQRAHTIRQADQIIVLDDGEVAGVGTHDELFQGCEAYREIVISQQKEKEVSGR